MYKFSVRIHIIGENNLGTNIQIFFLSNSFSCLKLL